mgnify:CR=1 FL=1
MIILGFVAIALLAFIVDKKVYNAYKDNSYDQNINSCSILDYEIADMLA